MTEEELDALPEIGGITFRDEIRDGKKVRIAVMSGNKVLWSPPDEPAHVYDLKGNRWNIGYHKGVRYKQRAPESFWP